MTVLPENPERQSVTITMAPTEFKTEVTTSDSPISYVALFLTTPFIMIWEGYVATLLWKWFVVPVFNMPPLTIAQMIGIAVLVALFRFSSAVQAPSCWRIIGFGFFAPAFYLFLGWVTKAFL